MNKKILLIVEGKKAEPKFFNKLQEEFNLEFDIYCFETNIYSLYKIMEDNDFNVNIKDILLELHPEQKELLSNTFLYTYLIFDLDPHHTKKDDTRSIEQIVNDNVEKVKEMASYFVDETDPTVGKLYINYPMMESYKACNSFFDNDYMHEAISINELSNFKEYVGEKKLSNIRIDKYSKDNFKKLIVQNIFKMNFIFNSQWKMPNYSDYLIESDTKQILSRENIIITKSKQISVLNTSVLIIVDYYGNKDGFYTNLYIEFENQTD